MRVKYEKCPLRSNIFKETCTHIIQLCRESANTHPGGVRFNNAVYSANMRRRHAEARAHSAHSAVGGGHKRISAWNEKEAVKERLTYPS